MDVQGLVEPEVKYRELTAFLAELQEKAKSRFGCTINVDAECAGRVLKSDSKEKAINELLFWSASKTTSDIELVDAELCELTRLDRSGQLTLQRLNRALYFDYDDHDTADEAIGWMWIKRNPRLFAATVTASGTTRVLPATPVRGGEARQGSLRRAGRVNHPATGQAFP